MLAGKAGLKVNFRNKAELGLEQRGWRLESGIGSRLSKRQGLALEIC